MPRPKMCLRMLVYGCLISEVIAACPTRKHEQLFFAVFVAGVLLAAWYEAPSVACVLTSGFFRPDVGSGSSMHQQANQCDSSCIATRVSGHGPLCVARARNSQQVILCRCIGGQLLPGRLSEQCSTATWQVHSALHAGTGHSCWPAASLL